MDNVGMSAGLDVRRAVNEANRVFRRYPARISLPTVLAAVLSYAGSTLTLAQTASLQAHPPHLERPFLLFAVLLLNGFGLFWLYSSVEVGVTAMYLRAREGAEPRGEQLGEVLHYPGLASVFWGLMVRYLGWIMLLMAMGLGVAVVVLISSFVSHLGAPSKSGIGAFAGRPGVMGEVAGVAVVAIGALIFYRYMFVLPMFAIARRAGPGFIEDCVGRAKRVWKTAALVLFVGSLPTLALSLIGPPAGQLLSPPHAGQVAAELAAGVVAGCFTAWFILVRAGLALQLTAAEALPSASSSPGLNTDGLPEGLAP
jgi:hypothetical protein